MLRPFLHEIFEITVLDIFSSRNEGNDIGDVNYP